MLTLDMADDCFDLAERLGVNLTFVGWYGRHNCGDEAFKLVHQHLFAEDDLEWICDQAIEPARGRKIILGGGDVFLDYYLQSIPEGEKFWVYGAGLGGIAEYDLVCRHQHRINGIWLRNHDDVTFLRERGIDARYTPDIVFNLRERALALPAAEPKTIKRMVVILSNNLYQTALRENDAKMVSYCTYFKLELIHALNFFAKFYEVVLLPFSMDPNDCDMSLCCDVFGGMRQYRRPDTGEPNVRIGVAQDDPWQSIEFLRSADLIVSMKFHGLIFAVMLGIPLVNIGISRKTALFCSSHGLDHLSIEPYSFCKHRLQERVKAAELPQTRLDIFDLGESLFNQARHAAAEFHESLVSA